MKVLLVNGSPRRGRANSQIILEELRRRLGEGHEYSTVEATSGAGAPSGEWAAALVVLAFPLYVDGVPAELLSWLVSYEEWRRRNPQQPRTAWIAVANCGFKEGIQNATALRIVENFCRRAGVEWRGGLGLGAGEMLGPLRGASDTMPIKRPVSQALDAIAAQALASGPAGNHYASFAFPWFLYRAMGQANWRSEIRKNGLPKKALSARPYEASLGTRAATPS